MPKQLFIATSRGEYGRREKVRVVIKLDGGVDQEAVTWRLRKVINWTDLATTDPVLMTAPAIIDSGPEGIEFDIDLGNPYPRGPNDRRIVTGGSKTDLVHYTDANGRRRGSAIFKGPFYLDVTLDSDPTVIFAGGRDSSAQFDIVPISVTQARYEWLVEKATWAIAQMPDFDRDAAFAELNATRDFYKNLVTDDAILGALRRAQDWVERMIQVPFRAHRVKASPHVGDDPFNIGRENVATAEALPVDKVTGVEYDEIVGNVDYVRADVYRWGYIDLHRRPVIDVESIRAVYRNTEIFAYPNAWVTPTNLSSGVLQLMPDRHTSSDFYTFFRSELVGEFGHLFGDYIPDYWAIDFTWGLLDPSPAFEELLYLRAVPELLILSGSAARLGAMSESRSTGGTSESYSYGNMLWGPLIEWADARAKQLVPVLQSQTKGLQIIAI